METNKEQPKILKQKICGFKDNLIKLIDDSNQVVITAHLDPDYDALASIAAMSLICKRNKKASYIVIDDKYDELRENDRKMVDWLKDKYIVLNKEEYYNTATDNDLLVTVDVNKKKMTCFEDEYERFKNIAIIDHHYEDLNTISTPNKLITSNVSSCSEIFFYLLSQLKITTKNPDYYTYLLVGIYLDTDKLTKDIQLSTYDAVKGTIIKGADQIKVDSFFSLTEESDRRVQRLVSSLKWEYIQIPIAVGGMEEYTRDEVSKAADYLLKYNPDAAIAAGKNKDGKYFVSARCKNERYGIDELMRQFNGGGGNLSSASCAPIYFDSEMDTKDVEEEIRKRLINVIRHKKIED